MARAANADVQIRAREKGAKVYAGVQARLDRLSSKVKAFGLISGAAAIGGVAALTARSFQQVDILAKHADRLGTSTEKLAALQHLTQLTGGSSENMSKSLLKAQKALGEFAATGSGTAAPFLRKLNLDTDALIKLKPDELFNVYADAIRGLGTRSEQTAASAALFGDRTGEMLNIIDAGKDALIDAEEEVIKYGIALNRVDSAKIEAANDAIFKVKERFTGVGNVIASKVAPVITAIANRFLDSGVEAEVLGNIVENVMDSIAAGAGRVGDAIFDWQIAFVRAEIAGLRFAEKTIGLLADIEQASANTRRSMLSIFGDDVVALSDNFLEKASIAAKVPTALMLLYTAKVSEASGVVDDLLTKTETVAAPASGFLGKIEESLNASANDSAEMLLALLAAEKPSAKISKLMADIQDKSEAAAEAVSKTREKLQEISVPGFEENDIEEKAREREEAAAQRLTDQLARKLATIETSLLTEEEREVQSLQRRQEIIDAALEAGLLSKERSREIEADILEQHEERLNKIVLKGLSDRQKFEASSGKQKVKQIFGDLANITSGVATSNKVMFRLNQAAAIGNAIISTHEGVTKTLAAYPWPLAGILAAVHLAAGVAQIAAIRSASPGGGTTPSLAGSTPTFNGQPVSPFDSSSNGSGNAAPVPASTITIIVEGSLIGDEGVKQLLADTLGELIDQDVIIIPPESTQAAVIRDGTGSGG